MEGERAAEQAAAVVPERESECLGQSSGSPRREAPVGPPRQPTKPAHRVQALEWLGRPKQHRGGLSRGPADDVHAGMESVDPVRVEAPGRPEHRAIAWSGTAMGVGGGIASVAEVRLDLHQADHQPFSRGQPVDQPTPDQIGGDLSAIPGVEASSQRGVKRHDREYRTGGIAGATRSAAREDHRSAWTARTLERAPGRADGAGESGVRFEGAHWVRPRPRLGSVQSGIPENSAERRLGDGRAMNAR